MQPETADPSTSLPPDVDISRVSVASSSSLPTEVGVQEFTPALLRLYGVDDVRLLRPSPLRQFQDITSASSSACSASTSGRSSLDTADCDPTASSYADPPCPSYDAAQERHMLLKPPHATGVDAFDESEYANLSAFIDRQRSADCSYTPSSLLMRPSLLFPGNSEGGDDSFAGDPSLSVSTISTSPRSVDESSGEASVFTPLSLGPTDTNSAISSLGLDDISSLSGITPISSANDYAPRGLRSRRAPVSAITALLADAYESTFHVDTTAESFYDRPDGDCRLNLDRPRRRDEANFDLGRALRADASASLVSYSSATDTSVAVDTDATADSSSSLDDWLRRLCGNPVAQLNASLDSLDAIATPDTTVTDTTADADAITRVDSPPGEGGCVENVLDEPEYTGNYTSGMGMLVEPRKQGTGSPGEEHSAGEGRPTGPGNYPVVPVDSGMFSAALSSDVDMVCCPFNRIRYPTFRAVTIRSVVNKFTISIEYDFK